MIFLLFQQERHNSALPSQWRALKKTWSEDTSEKPEYLPESLPNDVVLGSAMKPKQVQWCF